MVIKCWLATNLESKKSQVSLSGLDYLKPNWVCLLIDKMNSLDLDCNSLLDFGKNGSYRLVVTILLQNNGVAYWKGSGACVHPRTWIFIL